MKRISLIFAQEAGVDVSGIFSKAFRSAGFDVEEIAIPPRWRFDRAYVRELRLLVQNARQRALTVVLPPAELFLGEADLLVSFSAYSDWYDPHRMVVIPHLWPPIGLPSDTRDFAWHSKPPLTVGFMGRAFRSSFVSGAVRAMPSKIKKWLLSGALVRDPWIAAVLNEYGGFFAKGHNVFARLEAIEALETGEIHRTGHVKVESREGFSGTGAELSEYRTHLTSNTYVLCPRGTENYSYRIYETLAYGRIPVIIDTDIVLPDAIDWATVSLIVPYERLNQLSHVILADYESRSSDDFLKRQRVAFAAVQSLEKLEWLDRLVNSVASGVRATRRDRRRKNE